MIAVYTMVGIWYGINMCVGYAEEHEKKGRVFKGLECHFGYTSRYPKLSSNYRGDYSVITVSLVCLIASVRQRRGMVAIIQGWQALSPNQLDPSTCSDRRPGVSRGEGGSQPISLTTYAYLLRGNMQSITAQVAQSMSIFVLCFLTLYMSL